MTTPDPSKDILPYFNPDRGGKTYLATVALILALVAIPLLCIGVGLLISLTAFAFSAAAVHSIDRQKHHAAYARAQTAAILALFEIILGGGLIVSFLLSLLR